MQTQRQLNQHISKQSEHILSDETVLNCTFPRHRSGYIKGTSFYNGYLKKSTHPCSNSRLPKDIFEGKK